MVFWGGFVARLHFFSEVCTGPKGSWRITEVTLSTCMVYCPFNREMTVLLGVVVGDLSSLIVVYALALLDCFLPWWERSFVQKS